MASKKLKKGSQEYINFIRQIQSTPKMPRNKQKHVGVELEFSSPLSHMDIAGVLADAGVGDKCHVKSDSSINTEDDHAFSIEVCVIDTQRSIYKTIQKVCKVLNKVGCIANDSCGLHVHLDMRTRSVNNSYKRLVLAQPLLEKQVDPARINGEYCRRNHCEILDYILNYDDYGNPYYSDDENRDMGFKVAKYKDKLEVAEFDNVKYKAINPLSLEEHETLEVRLHEGTLDSKKIKDWIKLLVNVTDGKKAA